MIAPLLDLAEQLATIRNLLMAAFMAAQDLGEPDKRGGLVTCCISRRRSCATQKPHSPGSGTPHPR